MNIKKHHDDVIKTGKEMFVEIRGSPFGDIVMHWYGFKMFIINILILILAVIILLLFPISYIIGVGSRIIQEKDE